MTTERSRPASIGSCLLWIALAAPAALAQDKPSGVIERIGFDQKLGVQLPLELRFHDDAGHERALAQLFGRRPVILVPVYYDCPMLCNQLLNGLTRSLRPLSMSAGRDFDVVAFTINPAESSELAGRKKAAYLEQYDRAGAESGWHFLTGDVSSIEALAEAIGFRYTFNPATKLFAHAAGIVVVTTDGRIARYFYGIDFPPKELESEIEHARGGQIGSPIGRLLLLCYDYDAATGKYTLSILRLLRLAGTATAVGLGGLVGFLFRREARSRRQRDSRAEPAEIIDGRERPPIDR
jgi:protein SCO1/2